MRVENRFMVQAIETQANFQHLNDLWCGDLGEGAEQMGIVKEFSVPELDVEHRYLYWLMNRLVATFTVCPEVCGQEEPQGWHALPVRPIQHLFIDNHDDLIIQIPHILKQSGPHPILQDDARHLDLLAQHLSAFGFTNMAQRLRIRAVQLYRLLASRNTLFAPFLALQLVSVYQWIEGHGYCFIHEAYEIVTMISKSPSAPSSSMQLFVLNFYVQDLLDHNKPVLALPIANKAVEICSLSSKFSQYDDIRDAYADSKQLCVAYSNLSLCLGAHNGDMIDHTSTV
ncbi:hypothetical protein C8J56DRAFT_941829 [Mycena floridula]|nr:hypothetical protein C8J56DRAFT_941829 [Mycena floridula]